MSLTDTPHTPSSRPRRVQWASKTQVEHVEKVPDHEEDDPPRALDEHGLDPLALARLHRALESYQRRPSTSSAAHVSQYARLAETPTSYAGESPPEPSEPSPSALGEHHPHHADLDERVYVDAGETAGLPRPLPNQTASETREGEEQVEERGRKEARVWKKRAWNVVRTHTKRGKKLAVRKDGRDRGHFSNPKGRPALHEKTSEHDLESNAGADSEQNITPLPLGRGHGVLSALLSLYNSAGGGGSGSVSSSAGTSRAPSSERSDEDRTTTTGLESHAHPASSPPGVSSGPSKPKPAFHIPLPTPSSMHLPSPNAHLPKIHTPKLHTRNGRPKAAANSGGVVGSLIATSGNITGAAAPGPSTIAPNVRRKGWGLTRYELAPDAPTPPLPTPSGTGYFEASASTPDTDTPESGTAAPVTNKRSSWGTLVDWLPHSRPPSPSHTPATPSDDDATNARGDGKAYRRARKDRRRKAEIFITKHVAEIMQRQEFLLKLARALMMFAAPTHRLQSQIQSTARVLDLAVSTLYLPNVMLISFDDTVTSTSQLKFIQQGSSLDLGKLLDAHRLYWKVIHDMISVSSASASLDFLMRKPPLYRGWHVVLLGGLCSSAICPLAFSGSFVDALVALPLGALLVLVQSLSSRNELYSNVFEITIATLLSFISAGLASTSHFCYAAVASSSVVLILPGFFVLCGSLELASRQIVSGAVRICFAVIYSLFLGFGLAIGAEFYSRITGLSVVGPDDYTCASSHRPEGPWWQRTASIWWAFLCVPAYSLILSLRNQAPFFRKELLVTIVISCGGWAANHFAGVYFLNRPDIQSAVGAFAVGLVANIYARFFSGNAYVVMITGILFQLPSGVANGGLLTFAAVDNKAQQFESYQAGFQVALQLVAVAIGLTVGLFTSVVVVHPLGGSRRRAAGLFSL